MQPMGGFPQGGPMVHAAAGDHGPKGQVRAEMTVLLLNMIPGYGLYWFWTLCNEMSSFLKRDEPSALKIIGLSIVTCGLYALYWQVTRLGALVQECQQRAGVPNAQNQGIMYLIPIYNVILLQGELNKAWSGPA